MKNLQLQTIISISITLLLAACSRWEPEICNDGLRCPRGCTADRNSCITESCGNYLREPGEECDDGNNNSGDGCRKDCQLEECGDGLISEAIGEQCEGPLPEGRLCGPTCLWAACGNGITDPGEVCDDGNNVSGDSCSADCRSLEVCGNKIIDINEVCDDGNADVGDRCSFACQSDETCGNGFKDDEEECDCGEGTAMPNPDDPASQYCDNGQNSNTSGYCRRDCVLHCGDGVEAGNEQCDVDSSVKLFCVTEGRDMGTFQCYSCRAALESCTDLTWQDVSPPEGKPQSKDKPKLTGIRGTINDILFAFGPSATVLRYIGVDPLLPDISPWVNISLRGEYNKDLADLWISNEEIFAIGKSGGAFRGALAGESLDHFSICDGNLLPRCEEEDLVSIWGVTEPRLNIFIIQADGDTLHNDEGNQSQWNRIPAPEEGRLNDIWGLSLERLFAVGDSGTIFHFAPDMQRWHRIETDVDVDEDLLSIWGSPEGAIFVVGASGTILRKDDDDPENDNWEPMAPPTTKSLSAVWGTESADVFAAGRDGTLLHFDGSVWAPVRPPSLSSERIDFNSIWAASDEIFVVDEHGNIYHTSRGTNSSSLRE